MIRYGISLAISLLSAATPAQADPASDRFPDWDIQKFCADRMRPVAVPDCVKLQSDSRQRVHKGWAAYSVADREECLDYVLADDIPPSFMRLDHCLSSTLKGRRRQ